MDSQGTYPVKINIIALDRQNLLLDIANVLSSAKTNIIKADVDPIEKDEVKFKFVLEVKSTDHLNDLISSLKKVKNVTDVFKLNEKVLLK